MKLKIKKKLPILRAFRYRNFCLYFVGQGISQIGNWSTILATSWLVYQLTESAWLLGVVGFASRIPTLFISPIAGVIADRGSRHRIVIITQILSMVQSLLLAVLALTGIINVWQIIVLGLFQGIVNALYMPTLQAFVKEIIEQPEDLGNAIALNSSLISSARLIGPAVAGFLVASVGAGICFLLDGLSYIAVIAAFLVMKVPATKIVPSTTSTIQKLKEGFDYAYDNSAIRSMLLLLSLLGFFGLPYVILIPIFAADILKGGSQTLGLLMGASALGALFASVYLSSRSNIYGLEKAIAIAPMLLGTGFIIFSLSNVLLFSLPVMVLIGFSVILQLASTNTVLQTIVDDDKMGRLMSLVSMAFMGVVPFGNLFSGWLASQIGVTNTFVFNGLVCLGGSMLFIRQLKTIQRVLSS
ncbi:MFS transporter [Pleurocapsa sp. FMAR1]|uniref:MFS transporter n=1 Tax=Pleurocapsa sp. FMAR1 TaxID=3040204 RepID=UPI0029C81FE8|nr:MFS transporter [Pleurocapsa sp. FMAR1]